MSKHTNIHAAGRKKFSLIIVLSLVTFLAIFSLAADISQNSGQFCSSCHAMRPEYYTWMASSHSRQGCTSCHMGTGVSGVIKLGADLTRWTYAEVTNSYIKPIRLFRSIDDDACFRCHTFNRQASPSGDLIIPHDSHTDSRVRCISCHSAVAHGDIARRGITRRMDFSDWDNDKGLQEMAMELVRPSMDACMSCHYRRKITTACDACHTDMAGPDNHYVPDFAVAHGDFARAELEDCNFCHGYVGVKKLEVKENTNLVEYTRNNNFCFHCHKVRPVSHEGAFLSTHGRSIASGKSTQDNCLVCHDNNVKELPIVTKVACADCHPASHKKDWRNGHLPPVPPGRGISFTCFMCHSSNSCLSCHYLPGFDEGTSGGAPPLDDWQQQPGGGPADFFM